MSNTGKIEYQVMQAINWYRKLKNEQPDFTGDVSMTIRNVDEMQLREYAAFCKETLHNPFELVPCYWISRNVDGLIIYIHSTEMKKETIYKPIM